jgi:hypothetical protein
LRDCGFLDEALEREPLHHAKPVLLVDNPESHMRSPDFLLNYGMGADDESDIGARDRFEQRFFFLGRSRGS